MNLYLLNKTQNTAVALLVWQANSFWEAKITNERDKRKTRVLWEYNTSCQKNALHLPVTGERNSLIGHNAVKNYGFADG